MSITPLKAIRLKCLDCTCGQPKEVKDCPCTDCPLYDLRFGKNPRRAGMGGRITQLDDEPSEIVKCADENS